MFYGPLFYLQVLLSEAKVLGLGPRFMSIYIHKLAVSSSRTCKFLFSYICLTLLLVAFFIQMHIFVRLNVGYIMMKLKA